MSELSIFEKFAKGGNSAVLQKGNNCVIYTRVSTKEQADNNLSLETQRKGCEVYVQKNKHNVSAFFGGTYESAQTDERKEFKRMIHFCKTHKEGVSYIIVYSLERFSRTGDNAIWLSRQLRELGISIISVTQPIDTSNPAGVLQQNILFLFGQYDNDLRRQKCVAGTREKLLQGHWVTKAPMGYDHVRRNGERFIVVNETGKLLRKAFLWKANESLSNETIRQKLWAAGLKVSKQRVSEIFKNPFYCGLIVHNSLEGKVVDGKHEKVISKELFLKVNEIQSKNPHGFKWEVENENIPLKRFLKCEGCGTYMRGYEVKAKKIYYYKCSTIGCNCNKNAEQLHKMFLGKLKPHVLDSKYIDLAKYQLDATFKQLNNNQKENKEICHKKQEEINKKIERLQERFILEEIERDLYEKFLLKYKGEKGKIEEQIQNSAIEVSNLMEYTDISIQIALKLTEIWVSGTYTDKYGLQVLMFPNGMYYNKRTDECRTPKENSIFPALACLSMDSNQKRSGLNRSIPEKSALVAPRGIEPPFKV